MGKDTCCLSLTTGLEPWNHGLKEKKARRTSVFQTCLCQDGTQEKGERWPEDDSQPGVCSSGTETRDFASKQGGARELICAKLSSDSDVWAVAGVCLYTRTHTHMHTHTNTHAYTCRHRRGERE